MATIVGAARRSAGAAEDRGDTELNRPRTWAVRVAGGPATAIARGTIEPLDDGKRSHVTIALDFARPPVRRDRVSPTSEKTARPAWLMTTRRQPAATLSLIRASWRDRRGSESAVRLSRGGRARRGGACRRRRTSSASGATPRPRHAG
jgi:hypothetical protein